jgi:dTDP-4-dehydrorhamnose 3,5-epimerase
MSSLVIGVVEAHGLVVDGHAGHSSPVLLEAVVHRDERGFFLETYRESVLAELGVCETWVQDNQARSGHGVLRGMHFSVDPGQAKLVRCARGRIVDVVVDIRRGSPTFGHWEAVELDDEACRQLYVPIGFAHGYCVVSEVADVLYRCSTYYDPARERGFAWDDPEVGIAWPLVHPELSQRDRDAPRFAFIADAIPFAYPG